MCLCVCVCVNCRQSIPGILYSHTLCQFLTSEMLSVTIQGFPIRIGPGLWILLLSVSREKAKP